MDTRISIYESILIHEYWYILIIYWVLIILCQYETFLTLIHALVSKWHDDFLQYGKQVHVYIRFKLTYIQGDQLLQIILTILFWHVYCMIFNSWQKTSGLHNRWFGVVIFYFIRCRKWTVLLRKKWPINIDFYFHLIWMEVHCAQLINLKSCKVLFYKYAELLFFVSFFRFDNSFWFLVYNTYKLRVIRIFLAYFFKDLNTRYLYSYLPIHIFRFYFRLLARIVSEI